MLAKCLKKQVKLIVVGDLIYKGILMFKNGRKEVVPIPGITKENDVLYIPESITVDKKFFKLDKLQESEEFFIYLETDVEAPRVPYRIDLH